MRIEIVGNGFSAVALFSNLAKLIEQHINNNPRDYQRFEKITICGPDPDGYFGKAYDNTAPGHLLNVPCGNMSMYPDHPNSFYEFLPESAKPNLKASFVPRFWFKRYIQRELYDAIVSIKDKVRLSRSYYPNSSLTIMIQPDGKLKAPGSDQVYSDIVVIATGWGKSYYTKYNNFTEKYKTNNLFKFPYIRSGRISDMSLARFTYEAVEAENAVIILGSNLSAVDEIMTALQSNKSVILISNSGELPIAHRISHHPADPSKDFLKTRLASALNFASERDQIPHELKSEVNGFMEITCRAIRSFIKKNVNDGYDVRDVITSLRKVTPVLWRLMNLTEKRRFLKFYRSKWDKLRHRMAPAVYDTIRVNSDRIHIVKDTITSLNTQRIVLRDGNIVPSIILKTLRGTTIVSPIEFVKDCRNLEKMPNIDVFRHATYTEGSGVVPLVADRVPLFNDLHPKEISDLGFFTDAFYRIAVNVPNLYYLGPGLRARNWEAIAVPELRVHAKTLAHDIFTQILEHTKQA